MKKIHNNLFERPSDFYFSPSDFKYNFAEIRPEEIHEHWAELQTDIASTLKYAPEDNICSGDVYMILKTNNSFRLFVGTNSDGNYVGFFIIQMIDQFSAKTCHIWLTNFKESAAFSDSGKMIFNFAKRYNCKKITCASTRAGMETLLEQFGMYKSYITYEMRL